MERLNHNWKEWLKTTNFENPPMIYYKCDNCNIMKRSQSGFQEIYYMPGSTKDYSPQITCAEVIMESVLK